MLRARGSRIGILVACVLLCRLASAEVPVVPSGYRGIAVPVTNWLGEAVKAGDRVDVVVAYNRPLPPKDAKEGIVPSTVTIPVVATFLQNVAVIRILSTDHVSGQGAIELAVNPNEGQYLVWALTFGKGVVLSIRAPGDKEMHPMEEASMNKFSL